jgi:hypothetical protein
VVSWWAGWAINGIERKGGAFRQSCHLLLPHDRQNRGGEEGARRRHGIRSSGALRRPGVGATRRGGRGGSNPLPISSWGSLWRRAHGGRLRRAEQLVAAALRSSGGGRVVAGRLLELEGDAEGRFIGEKRRWRRGGGDRRAALQCAFNGMGQLRLLAGVAERASRASARASG